MRRWRSIIKSAAAQHRYRLPIFLSLNLPHLQMPGVRRQRGIAARLRSRRKRLRQRVRTQQELLPRQPIRRRQISRSLRYDALLFFSIPSGRFFFFSFGGAVERFRR